ncbi:LAME_0G12068g1_1 [Lachancea meyersii CBS 8951]|uniref:holo-[acyl-carrier-protein] synthase n=1 Tax=Lachancea meyersii CBS 8951 TaxID=1266667 RepID=A0A1G4K9H7_9SACH|nr:LAME_0G12068g1_1 [Lachancea meyersii CBS 8951]
MRCLSTNDTSALSIQNSKFWVGLESMLPLKSLREPLILVCDSRDRFLDDDYEFEALLRLFSLEIQHKILSRKNQSLRNTALCNQILQLTGISTVTGLDFRSLKLEYTPYGKPVCPAMTGLAFNMSNSDGLTAMYLDAAPNVGIDLASTRECLNFGDGYLETFKSIFSARELDSLEQTPAGSLRDRKFTHYWSLKEAYTKLTGTGLNCDLSAIDIGTLEPWQPTDVVQTMLRDINGERIIFQSQWLKTDVVVSVCKRTDSQSQTPEKIPACVTELRIAELAAYLHSTK